MITVGAKSVGRHQEVPSAYTWKSKGRHSGLVLVTTSYKSLSNELGFKAVSAKCKRKRHSFKKFIKLAPLYTQERTD